MNRLPRPGLIAALAVLGAMPMAESARPVIREPKSLPPPFRDNEKIRAAEAKRERRAAKWCRAGLHGMDCACVPCGLRRESER